MKIDLMGNTLFTPHQLIKVSQSEVRKVITKEREENINRRINAQVLGIRDMTAVELFELDEYKNSLLQISIDSAKNEDDNDLLINVIAYEYAVKRLERYLLSDSDNSENSLEAMGIGLDEIEVVNPLISQDLHERKEAQSIIDEASVEIKELYDKRKEARQ